MKKDNIILQKTFDFSLAVIEIYKTLVYKKKEYVMSKHFHKVKGKRHEEIRKRFI